MVNQYRAPRQWSLPRTGGQHRLALVLLTVWLVSVGTAMGIALLSGASARAQGPAAPQGIEMQPVPAEAVVVGTTHVLTFQLTDADGNPMQEAGRSVLVIIEPPSPHPHQVEPQLASVDPTVMLTNARGQATTTLTVGHTSGSIQLVVITDTLAEFVLSALPDRDSAHLVEVSGNNQVAAPGEELEEPLVVRLEDQFGNPILGELVVFTRLVGDGEFVDTNAVTSRTHVRGATGPLRLTRPSQTVPPVVRGRVITDSEGKASVRYRPGDEALQVVSAQAQSVPNDPVIFRINLGPLAGNGIEPINMAVGDRRGYTANHYTNNISVFDATGPSDTVVSVIDLKLVQTGFGSGSILGVAVNAMADRLYVYGLVDASGGSSVVLLVVDTTTNKLVGPTDPNGDGFPDPDVDGLPGLTLFTTPPSSSELTSLTLSQILGQDFGNLVTVDEQRHRIYAVVPGVVEEDVAGNLINIENGMLVVIDGSSDALAMPAPVPVGEVPTGVAVTSRTNRIYVTNRGFDLKDTSNDTVTVINGNDLTVIDTITVGRGPLGVKVDDIHDVIYVANLFGEETLESPGALSVINGETHTVIHIPTAGITDLAVLMDVKTDLLDNAIDRI